MLRPLLLIQPPLRGLLEGFATGLWALASYVRRKAPRAHVEILDLGPLQMEAARREVEEALERAGPDTVVGITTTTASYWSALRIAEHTRAARRDAVVVMGGHHASAQDEVVLREHQACVDYVVRGEGEIALFELLKRLPDTASVPGISQFNKGKFTRNLRPPPLGEEDLDLCPPIYGRGHMRSAPGKFECVTYVSARGCPLKCAFCAVANAKIRAKSIRQIVFDLRQLVTVHGYQRISIEDNFFAHSTRRTLELCASIAELRREPGMPEFEWDCQTRSESMQNPGIREAMADAGCTAVFLGVESLVPRELEYLRKTVHPEAYLESLTRDVIPGILSAGIGCNINLQLGITGSGPADADATLRRLARLGDIALTRGTYLTVYPQLHVIYPGTQHYVDAKSRFKALGDTVFESFVEWEARQEPILCWLGEQFAHGTGGLPDYILNKAALAEGRFEVDSDKVIEIQNELIKMERIEGIRIFRYGKYLVQPRLPSGSPSAHDMDRRILR